MNTRLKRNKTAAIKFVNEVRKALGKKPINKLPLGIPQNPKLCPLALGIEDDSVEVDQRGIQFNDNPIKVYVVGKALGFDISLDDMFDGLDLEKEIARFVTDFDAGKYPELVNFSELVRRAGFYE